MNVVQVTAPAKLDAVLNQYRGKSDVFLLLHAGWCPDCVKADPIIRASLGKLHAPTLIVADVGDRATYRDPKFAYRVHSTVKLERIPTLIHVTKDGFGARLVEGELFSEANVDAFVRKAKL